MSNKKEKWKVEFDKRQKARINGMKNMTDEQKNAIAELYNAVNNVVSEVQECFDIRVSDINKLEDAKWKIYHAFNMQGGK